MPQLIAMHTSAFDALAEKAMQLFGFVNRPSRAARHRPAAVQFAELLSKATVEADSNVSANEESLFMLGRIALTPSATALLDKHRVNVATLLTRHQRGDWGCIDGDDREDNIKAVSTSGRIVAMFQLPMDNGLSFMPADEEDFPPSVLISTNGSRQVTTVLTPEDLSR